MRSLSLLSLILAAAFLLSATVVVVRTKAKPTAQPQTSHETLPLYPSSRLSDHEKKQKSFQQLRALFQEHPDLKESLFIRAKDWATHEKARGFLPQLTSSNCLTLISEINRGELPNFFISKLYERLGELDHQAAFALLSGSPVQWDLESPKHQHFIAILLGWSKTDPAKAWVKYQESESPRNTALFGLIGVPRTIFQNWSELDPETAFHQLKNLPPLAITNGISGYLRGLPDSLDFPREAVRLEELKQLNWALLNSEFPITRSDNFTTLFSSRWMNIDPDAASKYWLTEQEKGPQESKDLTDFESFERGAKLPELINNWITTFTYHDPAAPRKAAEWLSNNPDILQNRHFQKEGFSALARRAPKETLALIRQIDSKYQQVSILLKGLSVLPSSADEIGEPKLTRAFSPDLIQQEINTGRFTGENLTRLQNGLADRQAYEAQTKN